MDSANNTSGSQIDMYQLVTNQIITLLEKGVIPWQKPWKESGMPMNLISKRSYRGINLWLLNALPYDNNYFLTWEQLKSIGASVNKDEKGHIVVFWKNVKQKPEEKKEDGSFKTVPMLRYYKVFNVSQCRDIPADLIPVNAGEPKELDPMAECEGILNFMPDMPLVTFLGKGAAYYNIEKDEITLPKMKGFKSSHAYYATLFHELVHSTGHEKRLDRKSITDRVSFGTESYALEELVAEMGAAFLCRYTGVLPFEIENAVAYIDNWLTVLKNDKRFIIQASGAAQKAVDFILSKNGNDTKDDVKESTDESVVS